MEGRTNIKAAEREDERKLAWESIMPVILDRGILNDMDGAIGATPVITARMIVHI